MANKILSREDILAADDLQLSLVETPEWGGDVYARALTARERSLFEQSLIILKGKQASISLNNIYARLVQMACVDANGKHMFSLKDVEALGNKSSAPMERVAARIQELSKLKEADIAELTANFTGLQTVDSPSS